MGISFSILWCCWLPLTLRTMPSGATLAFGYWQRHTPLEAVLPTGCSPWQQNQFDFEGKIATMVHQLQRLTHLEACWRLLWYLQSSKSSISRIRNPWGDAAVKQRSYCKWLYADSNSLGYYDLLVIWHMFQCVLVEVLVVLEINSMFKGKSLWMITIMNPNESKWIQLNKTMDPDPGDLWDFLLIHWLPLRCFHCWARW